MDCDPFPDFMSKMTEAVRQWSVVSLEFQRRSDARLERASGMVVGLVEMSGLLTQAFELLCGSKNAETDALRLCNEANLARIAGLVKDRDSLRDRLAECQAEVRRLTELVNEFRSLVAGLAAPAAGATVNIGDITARAASGEGL